MACAAPLPIPERSHILRADLEIAALLHNLEIFALKRPFDAVRSRRGRHRLDCQNVRLLEIVGRTGPRVPVTRGRTRHVDIRRPVPKLDVETKGLREGNRVEDVETVHAGAATVARAVAERL